MRKYSKEEHNICLDDIDQDALYIISTLQSSGFTAYLVGGSIRDLLLGHKPKDFDISTSARPEDLRSLFKGRCLLIGRRFRLAHIRFKDKIIEVSTFRSGSVSEENLIVHDNTWGSPEEDVLRRDFKINGLFFDPTTETIIDYVGGFQDIQNRLLEVIGDPLLRFKQDPVRMIRMLKFLARFDLRIDEKTKVDFMQVRHDILKSSQARILEEILRMLHCGCSEKFFRLMSEYGLLELLLPEIGKFVKDPEGEEVFNLLRELDHLILKLPSVQIDRAILVSCLLFPIIDINLKNLKIAETKPLQPSLIQSVVSSHIETSFRAFLQLSRKIKGDMFYLLCWQYRMVPIARPAKMSYKAPRTTLFLLALKFLNLRARRNESLLEEWTLWQRSYSKHKSFLNIPSSPPVKRRRRSRRR